MSAGFPFSVLCDRGSQEGKESAWWDGGDPPGGGVRSAGGLHMDTENAKLLNDL